MSSIVKIAKIAPTPCSRLCSLEEQGFKCGILLGYDAAQRLAPNSEAPVLAGLRLRVRVLGLIDFHYTFHQLVADIEREMTTLLCSECGKSFTEAATLFIHQSRTHDKTTHSCDECGTDVIGKVTINNHKRRHKTPVVKNLQSRRKTRKGVCM